MNPRLLIIGLDGATWDVLKPLAAQGCLPTIKRLIATGSQARLISTIPPITGAAWTSLATGLNPGKTGVLDFLNRRDSSYKLYVTTSQDFQRRAFWDIASKSGYRVGIVNYPMLYPTYPINGFMVSGVGSLKYFDITYPKHLHRIIDEVAQGYSVDFDIWNPKYDDEVLFIKDLVEHLEKRIRVICHLMQEEPWDVFVAVYSCTDWILHAFWKHFDNTYPNHDPEKAKQFMKGFVKFWKKVDSALSKMLKLAGPQTTTFLVSDHGFGPLRGTFNVLTWLRRKGFLVMKSTISPQRAVRKVLRQLGRIILNTPLKRFIPRRFVDKDSHLFKWVGEWGKSATEQISFRKSVAYALGNTIPFGGIWINLQHRDSMGIVPEAEYNALKQTIIAKLREIPQEIKQNMTVEIFDPCQIYNGDRLRYGPDILFMLNKGQTVIAKTFDDILYRDGPYLPRHTGAHRREGIFLASGPNIRRGTILADAQITDIAPTILHLLKVPIPSDTDGRILDEIFVKDSPTIQQDTERRREQRRIRGMIKRLKSEGMI